MKPGWKISLAFNFGLAGILFFILVHQQREKNTAAQAPLTAVTEAPAPAVSTSAPTTPPAEPKSFQWSQLESTNDYRQYVANLRAVGCPEPTVEDIVWGDAERVFSNQRRQLNLSGDEAGPWSRQRETRLVAYFLGQTPPADTPPPDDSQKNTATAAANPQSAPPVYPLAFKDVNLDKLGLTDAQKQGVQEAIAGIRQQFIAQIGGLNQDPADPAYLERWQKAQSKMDVTLRGWLGGKTFMAYELAAQAQAAPNP